VQLVFVAIATKSKQSWLTPKIGLAVVLIVILERRIERGIGITA